jgi:hypothetical protein
MTSVLNVDTIADKAGTGPVGLTKQIAAKVFVNFDGQTGDGIRGSFNFTSFTDNGTGDYTLNYTNSMANSNYSLVTMSNKGAQTDSVRLCNFITDSSGPATGSCRVGHGHATNTATDSTHIHANVHGDLA